MTKKGYKGVSLKEGVVEKLRGKAKEADKTLSAFLEEVLESYSKGKKEVPEEGSTITKGDWGELKSDIKTVRDVLEE